jgi:peptidoglycan/xylan/chitin deacetylase (PgdA/CDA1 family)
MRRSTVVAAVAAGCLVTGLAGFGIAEARTVEARTVEARTVEVQQAAAKAALRLAVSAPQYDSPGGTVPTIVTVYEVPKSSKVSISATGSGGSLAYCAGSIWQNPVRHTASRTCYLQLANSPGSYTLHGTAVVTTGTVVRTVSGKTARAVVADGVASPTPMAGTVIKQIERCSNTTDNVWLTFDDGGSKAQVTSILATLKRNNVKARFFFRGDWAVKNAALFKTIKSAGHVIGNHTDTHPALSRMGKTKLVKQITGGTAATGTPKLLRPPFGAGAFTTRLQNIAKGQGYELCRWTTDTYDWDGPSTSLMVERVKYGDYRSAPIAAGGVILMHGHGKNTAPGLQQIIDAVKAKKLKLQPLK